MVLSIFNRDKVYSPTQRIGKYTIVKRIGEGRYGICYQVYDGQRQYILKQLKRKMLKKSGVNACYEQEILMKLQHDNIPRFIKKVDLDCFQGYVLEYKHGNTFEDLLYLEKRTFTKPEIIHVGTQLIDILKHLHDQGIVHRDIRVPNCLYNGDKVFLIDFGLARWIDKTNYTPDMDFAFLGDFLLHLYYSSYEPRDKKKRPWYEELNLTEKELLFLKRLMGIEETYTSIYDVKRDYSMVVEY
jgi:serine/threonine-protein kinase